MHHTDRGRSERLTRRRPSLAGAFLVLVGIAAVATVASAGTTAPAAPDQGAIKVGLITKDVTNPFFVKMRAGATSQAKKLGAQLIYAAGKNSSDNAGQITAIENMSRRASRGFSSPWRTRRPRTPRSRRRGRPVCS
jgi:ABC-type sugar transport system substrate-binding protein